MTKNKITFMRVKDLPSVELFRTNGIDRPITRHIHFVFSISIVEAGLRLHETPSGKYLATPGSIILVNTGETHSSSIPDGYDSSYFSRSIRVDPLLIQEINLQVTGRKCDTVDFQNPVIYDLDLFQQILELNKVLYGPAPKLEKEVRLLEVIAQLYDRHSKRGIMTTSFSSESKPISRICEYLNNCFNENVSLNKLSEIADLSPFYLSRVFSKAKGIPPHAYLMQIRLRKATEYLAAGKSLVDVAIETGFCDQSHFQKAFKKKFGITPGQYGCYNN